MEQVIITGGIRDAYFWATHSGAEIDLLFHSGGKRYGVEFKCNEAPKIGKSMHIAITDLGLDHLYVVYPGHESYPVSEKISVLALADIGQTDSFQTPSSPA